MSKIKIKSIGFHQPETIHNRAARMIEEQLLESVGDVVDFHLEENILNIGRSQFELPEMVISGEYTLCYLPTSYLAKAWVPEFGIFDLPFLIEDRKAVFHHLDGSVGKKLAEKVSQETPFQLLAYWDNGYRQISNSVRPIHKVEDCRGLQMRTLDSPIHGETFAALGMNPEVMDINALGERMAAGTIDAQDNPLTNIYNIGIYKHHRYITMTSHIWGGYVVLCNQQAYRSWPSSIREAVQSAVLTATNFQRNLAIEEDEIMRQRLSSEGAEIVDLTPQERQRFVSMTEDVRNKFREETSDDLF